MSGQPQTRHSRTGLSREAIIDAALRSVDVAGEEGLTFRALGGALGVAPTAIYRYYLSKDDLLLAMADRLLSRALEDVPAEDDWRSTLRSVAFAIHDVYLTHPRLAVLVAARTSVGASELRLAEIILRALEEAGVPRARRAIAYRVFEDTVLAWACFDASYASIGHDAALRDRDAWRSAYGRAAPELFPAVADAKPDALEVDDRQIFATVVEVLITSIGRDFAPEG